MIRLFLCLLWETEIEKTIYYFQEKKKKEMGLVQKSFFIRLLIGSVQCYCRVVCLTKTDIVQ